MDRLARVRELQAKRRYAALLMNYACTITCDHCCFRCSPTASRKVMSVEDGALYLEELHQLDRLVHIAGGDPFMHYDRMRDIIAAAVRRNAAPHFVETNGSWGISDQLVRDRLMELRDLGVLWLLISTDPFHLRHVPWERVWRVMAIAEEVFGEKTTMGLVSHTELLRNAGIAIDDATIKLYQRRYPLRLVGRARDRLACNVNPVPLKNLDLDTGWGRDPDNTCEPTWDPVWEIHVDPYGNVQTNCGVILGSAHSASIVDIVRGWPERSGFLAAFARRGVAFLYETAIQHGFKPASAYPQKCCLCEELRIFLRERCPELRALFGPDEIYAAAG